VNGLGRKPKTGAQAKQGQRRAGIVCHQGATTGASSNYATVERNTEDGPDEKTNRMVCHLTEIALRELRRNSSCPGVFDTRASAAWIPQSNLQKLIHGVPRIEYPGADSPKEGPFTSKSFPTRSEKDEITTDLTFRAIYRRRARAPQPGVLDSTQRSPPSRVSFFQKGARDFRSSMMKRLAS